jgi:hypothetical protein
MIRIRPSFSCVEIAKPRDTIIRPVTVNEPGAGVGDVVGACVTADEGVALAVGTAVVAGAVVGPRPQPQTTAATAAAAIPHPDFLPDLMAGASLNAIDTARMTRPLAARDAQRIGTELGPQDVPGLE